MVYIRYCEVCQYYESYSISPKVIRLNKAGVWLGVFSCLGLSIVANFQETSVKYVHYFGATLCFGVGTIYFWIQVICFLKKSMDISDIISDVNEITMLRLFISSFFLFILI